MASNIKLNTTSVGMVMDLISEGPIKLKNGLNSVFLNGTPMSNNVNRTKTLDIKGLPGFPNSDGTEIRVKTLINTLSSWIPGISNLPVLKTFTWISLYIPASNILNITTKQL